MATHKSAEKRARQTIKRTTRNKQALSTVRTVERRLREALASAETKSAQELLVAFASQAQKAVGKGRVHARSAQRKISRLSLAVHKLATGQLTTNQARQVSKRA